TAGTSLRYLLMGRVLSGDVDVIDQHCGRWGNRRARQATDDQGHEVAGVLHRSPPRRPLLRQLILDPLEPLVVLEVLRPHLSPQLGHVRLELCEILPTLFREILPALQRRLVLGDVLLPHPLAPRRDGADDRSDTPQTAEGGKDDRDDRPITHPRIPLWPCAPVPCSRCTAAGSGGRGRSTRVARGIG